MLVATGTFLVLLTWGFLLVLAVGLGLLPAALTNTDARPTQLVRHALWWGIALGSIVIVAFSLILPLASPAVGLTLVITAALLGAAGFRVAHRRRSAVAKTSKIRRWPWWTLVAALAVAQVTFAIAALGPVTNYDTGLYHLGAIAYGRDFAAVPGLANLYGPLGYATIEFPWASALSGAPWGADGFRLVNGFLMAAVAADLALRLRGPKRVGTFVLLVGVALTWGPMLGMADFWVTSPTQDASALALSLIVAAYLSDAVAGRKHWVADGAIALIAGITLLAVRTTMIVFVAATILVVVALIARRRTSITHVRATALMVGLTALVMGLVMGARDARLSGWLLYPLSLYPFDVPWRAPDPTPLRDATLGFHRNPADATSALDNWSWIPDWIARLPQTWEPYLMVALLGALLIVAFLAKAQRVRIPYRRILLATVPALLAIITWFVASPPAFRFIWGPLFLTLMIPLGWLLATPPRFLSEKVVLAAASVAVLAVSLVTLGIRIDWDSMTTDRQWDGLIQLPYAIAQIQDAPTTKEQLSSGLMIQVPIETDQCWANYPLCSPGAPPTLTQRGPSVSEGFSP